MEGVEATNNNNFALIQDLADASQPVIRRFARAIRYSMVVSLHRNFDQFVRHLPKSIPVYRPRDLSPCFLEHAKLGYPIPRHKHTITELKSCMVHEQTHTC